MKHKAKHFFTLLTLALLATACSPLPFSRPASVFPGSVYRVLDKEAIITIDPRMEFMAAIQSQIAWDGRDGIGPGGDEYGYANELAAFMSPYRAHPAVTGAYALMDYGFVFDAPCTFAINLEGKNLLLPEWGFSDNLTERPGLADKLNVYRDEFAALYNESGFYSFFKSHKKQYNRWLTEITDGLELPVMLEWMRNFYGSDEKHDFRIYLAPGFFPDGGYGPSIKTEAGKPDAYCSIIRAFGNNASDAFFPLGKELNLIVLHEFGHSWINPAFTLSDSDRLRFFELIRPVLGKMAALAYGDLDTMLQELVLRAAVLLAANDLGWLSGEELETAIKMEELAGFYPIRRVMELFHDYRRDRAKWNGIDDFAPVLIESLLSERVGLVAFAQENSILSPRPVLSLNEGFEGELNLYNLPQGFYLERASTLGMEKTIPSRISVVQREDGGFCLELSASEESTDFLSISRPIAVQEGELELQYSVSSESVYPLGQQNSSSSAGLRLINHQGVSRFVILKIRGTTGWKTETMKVKIDQNIAAIEFAVFLSESGTIWVDDIRVNYTGGE